eukprot:14266730-Alexandrium_andersonii.AAC.1
MSASLVGSEMCIRDSLKLVWPHQARPPGADGRGSPIGEVRRRGVGTLAPVSYTHLTLPTICSV